MLQMMEPAASATVISELKSRTHDDDKADWLKKNIHNEAELLKFLDDPNNNLEEQPTEILVALA